LRVLSFDPAGEKFGIAGVQKTDDKLSVFFHYLLAAPDDFSSSQKGTYMAHAASAIVGIIKPDYIVSEKPWGVGYSMQSLKELIGALKAEIWNDIKWQGVSEARRAVLGEGWGGANKAETAMWLLQYPWDISSKRFINEQLNAANENNKDGFDILDALLHAVCYLIIEHGLVPVHKPQKASKKKRRAT
jgi:hypothetical protein